MEKVDSAYTASDDAMKIYKDDFDRTKDDFDRAKDVLREARNQIHKGFGDLREDQNALAAENGVLDIDGSEILNINAGGGHHVHDQ